MNKTPNNQRGPCRICGQFTQRQDKTCIHCTNILKAEARYMARVNNLEVLKPNLKKAGNGI